MITAPDMNMESLSTSRWTGDPLHPQNYDDLPQLVKLARKGRNREVEFQWALTPDALRSLRRALFEAAAGYVGRYRAFDALLLSVANQALGEDDSLMAIPISGKLSAGEATCEAIAGGYRLSGRTTFDVFVGHGSGGFSADPWTQYLSPEARAALAQSIAPLGWDVARLQEARYRPVLNALYGMPVNYGLTEAAAAPSGSPLELALAFEGPFSAYSGDGERCLFEDPMGQRSGIYLWTIEYRGSRYVWYVGQTRRSFALRMGEHIASYLSGQYPPVDPAALTEGRHRRPSGVDVKGMWPDNLPTVLRNLPALASNTAQLLRAVQFHVAPVALKQSELDRVEGAICRWCRGHGNEAIRAMLQPGIRVPARIPGDRPLRLQVASESPIEGLPAEITE
ncbi:MAG: hypothetical protein R2712_26740 [Vicinamibacterales bacterium]